MNHRHLPACRALYRFQPNLSTVKNRFKNSSGGSGSRSSPKSNQFILVTHRTCPQNFIQIRPQLFEISCTQINKQKNKKTSCWARHLQNPSNKFDLRQARRRWWFMSGIWWCRLFQKSRMRQCDNFWPSYKNDQHDVVRVTGYELQSVENLVSFNNFQNLTFA